VGTEVTRDGPGGNAACEGGQAAEQRRAEEEGVAISADARRAELGQRSRLVEAPPGDVSVALPLKETHKARKKEKEVITDKTKGARQRVSEKLQHTIDFWVN
jgi:hypothetical protein